MLSEAAGIDTRHCYAGLARLKCPWVLGDIEWTDAYEKQAVMWLAKRLKKPISKLQEEDYWQNNVHVSLPYLRPCTTYSPHKWRVLDYTRNVFGAWCVASYLQSS